MNKEQQIKQMMLDVPQKIVAYDGNPAGQHLYGEQRQEIADTLYNAGYRKTFTSDFATDTQNVCKLEAENKHLLKLIENEHFSYQTTTGKKYSVFNTVRKQFAEDLKKRSYCDNVFKDSKWHRYVFVEDIDELLKEYEE